MPLPKPETVDDCRAEGLRRLHEADTMFDALGSRFDAEAQKQHRLLCHLRQSAVGYLLAGTEAGPADRSQADPGLREG